MRRTPDWPPASGFARSKPARRRRPVGAIHEEVREAMTREEELAEAEFGIRQAEEHLRKMRGWKAEILRLLEEEDKHG